MEAKEFLPLVLSDSGFYCVLGIKGRKVVQRFYNTIDSAADAASNFDMDGYNAYYAMGTFLDQESRLADNVQQVKAFYLDIDCGKKKPYKDHADAIQALRTFCKDNTLPKPTVMVNSGFGVHVYWVLNEPVSREVWLPVAEQLKQSCKDRKFHVDHVVTTDAARVLRVPSTHNYKEDPARDVEVIGALGKRVSIKAFSSCFPEVPVVVELPHRQYSEEDKETMEALMGNHIKKFSKILQKTMVGKGCTQIHNAVTNPADISYPEWLSVLSIAKHCDEGDKAGHLISKGHPNYSENETDKVLASIKYPHLCLTFEANNPEKCEGCPFKGKIKSPISIGMELREATAEDNVVEVPVKLTDASKSTLFTDTASKAEASSKPNTVTYLVPKYPYPYLRGANGGVYLKSKGKEGEPEEIEIYRNDLYLIKRLRDPQEGPSYVFRHHTKREGVQEFVVPAVKLSSKEEFRKHMGMNDIFLLRADQLMAYVGAWVKELQASHDEVEAKVQFGWTEDNKSFVVGDKEIFKDKIAENHPSFKTRQFMDFFEERGTLDGWKKVTEFYNRPNFEEHQHMFAMSFGSPLMEFVPNIHGGIYHLGSNSSGYGKTTGQWGGASVWGHPNKLVLDGDDTANSIWNRAEVWKNLPMYVDEISNVDAKLLSTFAYRVYTGAQRNRQSQTNQERFRGQKWSLQVGTTANVSLLEKITTFRATPKGEMQRVFELQAKKLLFTPSEAILARDLNQNLIDNFGHAGPVFIQYVLNHMVEVKELVDTQINLLITRAGLSPQNRIWAATTGTSLAGLIIAKRLGLIGWDLGAYTIWLVTKLKLMRESMSEMDVNIEDLVAQYYADNYRAVMRLRSTSDLRAVGAIEELVNPESMPMSYWVGRHEYDVCKLYLMVNPFKEWCVRQQLSYRDVVERIALDLNGKKERMRMGRGTTIDIAPMTVISLSWDNTNDQTNVKNRIEMRDPPKEPKT